MGITVVKLDVKAFGRPPPKPQRERIVWEAAKNPVGLSVNRLSMVTDLGVNEVKRIVERLHREGYLAKRQRSYFVGWVSVDNLRARARFSNIDSFSP